MTLLQSGKPNVARAAEAALLGTAADVHQFVTTGRFEAKHHDDRERVGN
ncbi:ALF repeat-containing protein [Micromonospora zingiberis]|nr:ALF repeat-containing protein [Micromonospora zingiberis]